MVSLDFRTRTDDDILAVDTREFFTEQLPELIATRREYVMAGARELGVAPFTVRHAFGHVDARASKATASRRAPATTAPRSCGSPTTTSPTSSTI